MKKAIITLVSLGLGSLSYGQNFIAGWDFQSTNVSTTFSSGFQADVAGSSTALLYANGSFGSTNFGSNAFAAQGIGVGNTNLSGTFQGNNGFLGGTAADNNTGTKSFVVNQTTGNPSFSIAWNNSSFTATQLYFDFDTQNLGDYGTDFTSTVPGLYINLFTVTAFNGTNSLGALSGVSSSESSPGIWTFNNDALDASALDGVADARLVFTLNDAVATPGNFYFDNIAVGGTVVPEPSTYAAIFGAIALAFVAYRRRRSA